MEHALQKDARRNKGKGGDFPVVVLDGLVEFARNIEDPDDGKQLLEVVSYL